ncbi:major facilitator superfamily domain-containing protein [Xylogone sp. PMI_703]|nr:major facilitator superfamily domain-containing protein [Xylogone sp. PMI_703]
MSAENEPTEASPLLLGEQPGTNSQVPDTPVWSKAAIRTVGSVAIFLILFAFADVLKYISTIRLIELGVCREYYLHNNPDLTNGNGDDEESLCKQPAIQQRLANLRGYLAALEAIPGLVLALPYGLIVDRVGERTLAGINIAGYLLSCAWILLVCFYWSVFPIWTAVLAPLFKMIGGGSPVLTSVLYSITAKQVPDTSRSLCFFLFMAAQLLTEIVAIMVTALLLEHKFLFTPMLLNFPVGLLCLVSLCIMYLTDSDELSSDPDTERNEEGRKLRSSIQHSVRVLYQILCDRNVLVLLATVPVAKLVNPITELMLQYIPRKFDLSLATASRTLSIQAIESLILLILILPTLKNLAQVKFCVMATKIDLYIAQCGFLTMSLGCLIMAFSQTFAVFILGLLMFTLGCSTRPALQSVLTDLVSREHIAVLYTVIALGDGIGSAGGALILNRTLAIAIGWNNKLYLGLPFVIGTLCYLFGFTASLFAGHRAPQLMRDT